MEIQQAESSFNCNKDGKKGIFVIFFKTLYRKEKKNLSRYIYMYETAVIQNILS